MLNICRRSGRLAVGSLMTAGAMLSGTALAVAAETPKAVSEAQDGVVQLETPRQRGAAFAVTSDGLFVTAAANVARTQDITLVYKGDKYKATRLNSSAPRGIALLRSQRPIGERPLRVQETDPKQGTGLWVLTVDKNGKPVVRRARLERVNESGSMETTRARTVLGQSGGALVTDTGRVIGVSAPPRPGEQSSRLVSFRLNDVPEEIKDVRADDGGGFPAIPVAIALGLLLLAANLAVRWARGRSLTTESPVPATPAPAPSPVGVPTGGPVDEIEVSIKPR